MWMLVKRSAWIGLLGVIGASTSACELVATVDRGKIPDGTGAGGGGAGGGGAGGSGGADAVCGDGSLAGGETCDDGNVTDGDGCSSTCAAESGWTCDGSPSACTDVDECTANKDNCDANAICSNMPGSFTCTCNAGYGGDGVTCADQDECALNMDNCDANAICSNMPGSFTCTCNTGYGGDGVTCADDDECALNTDNCGANAACSNTPGSFTCACDAGYSGDGVTCADDDECALNTDNCDASAACSNTPGSFTCACNAGYSGDGITCADDDECALNTDNCDANAACSNTPGSFTCACNAGYSGDGVTCADDDECALNTDNCDANATCSNTVGSFTCACNASYSGDGLTCAPVVQVVGGILHSCVRLSTGSVKCWGNSGNGQLGLGYIAGLGDGPAEMGANLPFVDLGAGLTATQITSGGFHECAILSDNSVKCWGNNQFGQLGLGDVSHRGDDPSEMGADLPSIALGTGKTVKQIAAGYYHNCAIFNDDTVKCWGNNSAGQLGLGDTTHRGIAPGDMGDNLPTVDLGTGLTAKKIAVGNFHTCAILSNDTVKCWGTNENGQLGQGDTSSRGDQAGEMGDNLPAVDLGAGLTAADIAVRAGHVCVILNNGAVKCWGQNNRGQLGLGDMSNHGSGPGQMGDNLPTVDLGTGLTAATLVLGGAHSCALLTDNTVKCWGVNENGQLGQGDLLDRGDQAGEMGDNLLKVDLGTGRTAMKIASGWDHVCAILDNNNVKCWGFNAGGQLGAGDTSNRGDAPLEMGDVLLPLSF